ncbi:endonuclease/exonuclease/phosphatase family protein [Hyphobacterium marinum]|uniref:Endonuclease/exonuclease/phosphatase family protein n=1 Tax=Hyphobacterium marinum TaxID=3116574 RepID=A0ABU7M1G3_9PROT|nr:endonuclease/exonuclease/phosphatase family protein [Hyphobacterium sp. Y6023]MEE2567654.1 endonuclease/exonuclease/phosphatase family protein [Hyphobacterium sp. Y6023]
MIFRPRPPSPLANLAAAGSVMLAVLVWLAPLWSGFDLFRQVWALIAIAALGLLALTLILRRWRPALICLAALVAISGPVAPEVARSITDNGRTPYPDAITTLTIATHNLWGRNEAANRAAAVLIEMDADVVALQEAFGESGDVTDRLRAVYPFEAECTRHSSRILSRLEIVESGCMQDLLIASRPAEYEWWRHQFPPSTWARIRLEDGTTAVVVSVHMTWPDPLSVQNEQRQNLAEQLRQFERNTMIVAGDFNAAAPSLALARMDRDFGLERRTRLLATWPSQGIGQRFGLGGFRLPTMFTGIDHVFAGEAWTTLSVERGPNTGSDHRPVMVRLWKVS